MRLFKFLFVFAALMSFQSCKSAKYQDLPDGLYAEIQTSKGNILVKLEYQKTPNTVANFVSLVEGSNRNVDAKFTGKRFYDGLKFHRVVNDFVIQGGDPLGTGEGSPGYRFGDEFPNDAEGKLALLHDGPGILSMANSGKDTNGSQFFITHKATPHLNGRHSVFGKVIEGQDVVNSIVQGDVMNKVEIIREGDEAKKFDAAAVFEQHLKDFNEKMKKMEEEKAQAMAVLSQTQKEMAAYFVANKGKAKTFPSGLKMLIIQKGTGVKPVLNTDVLISYAGYFENGVLFDSNIVDVAKKNAQYDVNRENAMGYQPFTIQCNNEAGLIPGFREGMLNMNYGEKAILYIPAHLAYGEAGAGSIIPPNSNLIFIIELSEKK
jgi:cyclophilin family peptidyl-prolyl cis-trans isomerase